MEERDEEDDDADPSGAARGTVDPLDDDDA